MIGFVGNSVLGCRLGRGRREATTCRGRYGVAAVVMNGDVSRREAMKVAGRWLVGSLVGMTSIDTVLAAQKPNTEESVVAICQVRKTDIMGRRACSGRRVSPPQKLKGGSWNRVVVCERTIV